jgi:lipoyl(octanoyl) transferase
MDYKSAWDYQEDLLRENVSKKSLPLLHNIPAVAQTFLSKKVISQTKAQGPKCRRNARNSHTELNTAIIYYSSRHPPVFTLGKSGNMNNVLWSEERLKEKGIGFFRTNRGGDITFHGPQQIVGYPILDLEKFDTDMVTICAISKRS